MPCTKPLFRLLGLNSRPGWAEVTPLSNLGLSFLSTKPLAEPSVPGNARAPAPLVQVAEGALAVKS